MQVCARLKDWTTSSVERIDRLVGLGVRRLSLPWDNLAQHLSRASLRAEAVVAALADADVALAWVELPTLTCRDDASFEQETDDAYMQMQVAQRSGADGVIIAFGHRSATSSAMATDALKRLATLAERQQVILSVRNVYRSAFEQVDEFHCAFRDVRSEALRLCLDNVEFQRSVVNPADAALAFSGRTSPVLLGDAHNGQPCVLGAGDAHVEPTVKALVEEGYAGDLLIDAAHVESALVFLAAVGALGGDQA